jgi:hypothetical protein
MRGSHRYELASWLFLLGSGLFAASEVMTLGSDPSLWDPAAPTLLNLKVVQTLLGIGASLLFVVGSALFILDARHR